MIYEPFSLGSKKHVFIDWDLIDPGYGLAWDAGQPVSWEMPSGLRLTPHDPRIDPEPLLRPEKPWEAGMSGGILFEDDGLYRLYYTCPDALKEGDRDIGLWRVIAYAESTDGVRWVRPKIGTVRYGGSTDNNLVYGSDLALGRSALGVGLFKDPTGRPEERYKLVHMGIEDDRFFLWGAVSPDGLHWKPLEKPLISDYMSDTQNVVAWDPVRGRYVGYFRGWTAHRHGSVHVRRLIAYAETERFESWPVPRPLVRADMHDGPDTDLYSNAYTPWPGADAHLMFPALYQRNRDVTEVHMMTSRDGLNWVRPLRRPVVPAGEPGSDSEGSVYAGCGLVSFRPGETSLPISPTRRSHNRGFYVEPGAARPEEGRLCLATLRRDGFISLDAEAVGTCATVIFTFSGGRLEVNAWTGFGGEIRIELADASAETRRSPAEPVAGHALEECDPISGDSVRHTVTWKGRSDLSAWAGTPVRLRLRLRRARLYAIQFV